MPKRPRKPRAIKRTTDTKPERVASGIVTSRPDLRQAGLFDLPPSWIAPCMPTLVRTAPTGPNWLHEIKHDGYRTVCVIDQGNVSIYTRRRHNWADRMPGIAQALAALKVRSAVIDGETIMADHDGVSDFFALHAALASRHAPHAALMAFDIMHIDGEDLRGRVLEDRRAILADVVLRRPHPWLHLSDATEGDGAYIWRVACEMGLEGIVSKRRGSRYISGRFDGWRKTKCSTTEHLVSAAAIATNQEATYEGPRRGVYALLRNTRSSEDRTTILPADPQRRSADYPAAGAQEHDRFDRDRVIRRHYCQRDNGEMARIGGRGGDRRRHSASRHLHQGN
jgi:bifunctional non-homologous end joining protein LigD